MRRDRIRNETIQKNVEVTPLQNKIEKKKKLRLKWFVYYCSQFYQDQQASEMIHTIKKLLLNECNSKVLHSQVISN